jgi:hypothetical protein
MTASQSVLRCAGEIITLGPHPQLWHKKFSISPRANWSYRCQLSTLQKKYRHPDPSDMILLPQRITCAVFSPILYRNFQPPWAIGAASTRVAAHAHDLPFRISSCLTLLIHHRIKLLTAFICRAPDRAATRPI